MSIDNLDRGCPRCGALPGDRCVDRNGVDKARTHRARDAPAEFGVPIGEDPWDAMPYGPLQEWVREHLPDLNETYALSALFGARAQYGPERVTPALVRERYERRASREAVD